MLVNRTEYRRKNSVVLLAAIGIANIGEWIYLISLNLLVLQRTDGSALAVAVLYMMKPLGSVLTNFWSGSVIDRLNKRQILMFLDFLRAFIVVLLPFVSSLHAMYLLVLLLSMASAVFHPASTVYITLLLPETERKRFNAYRSLVSSGAFVTGPAVAGLLFMIGTPVFALYINAIALAVSGWLTIVLPNLEKAEHSPVRQKLSLAELKKDVAVVADFSRNHTAVMIVYFVFGGLMVLTTAMDSLEAAFSVIVLGLSERDYGFLVSIAGFGIITGSLLTVWFSDRFSVAFLIGVGGLTVAAGYMVYAFSTTFAAAGAGFFLLAFALAFTNTGFHTFYQNSVPIEIMGRVGSLYALIEAVLVIALVGLFGLAAQLISISIVVEAGAVVLFGVAIVLTFLVLKNEPEKANAKNSL